MIATSAERRKLEKAGFSPEQAAAIIEIQWSAGMLGGAVTSLCIFGLLALMAIIANWLGL